MSGNPSVSILIPAYNSERTILNTLMSLRHQTVSPREVLVVDSSPNDLTEDLVRAQCPEISYHHSSARLLPHAARNRAVRLSHGELIVFTDPDAVARVDWLENLLLVHGAKGGAVCGAVSCYGSGWTCTGVHLTKFDKWLPGGPVRRVDIAPTVSLLLSRTDLLRAGDLDGGYMIGDTLFSWRLARLGIPIWFAPQSVVEHEHTDTWGELLWQMYGRGREFGQARRTLQQWGRLRTLSMTVASIVPLRLAKIVMRVLWNATRAGMFGRCMTTCPIILTGHVARLAGEVAGYFRRPGESCASSS